MQQIILSLIVWFYIYISVIYKKIIVVFPSIESYQFWLWFLFSYPQSISTLRFIFLIEFLSILIWCVWDVLFLTFIRKFQNFLGRKYSKYLQAFEVFPLYLLYLLRLRFLSVTFQCIRTKTHPSIIDFKKKNLFFRQVLNLYCALYW